MDTPFTPPARRKSQSPVPKNSFQRELDAKMKDRRQRGLSADLSDSGDELPSDDELLYNMTSKSRPARPDDRVSPYNRQSPFDGSDRQSPYDSREKRSPFQSSERKSPHDSDLRKSPFPRDLRASPYSKQSSFGKRPSALDEDDDDDGGDLMKTMRNPRHNSTTRKSPNPMLKRSPIMDDLDEVDEPIPSARGQKKPWERGFGGSQRERPGEANPRHRKTPTLYDSIEDDERPKPSPRPKGRFSDHTADDDESPRPKPRARGSKASEQRDGKSRTSSPPADHFGRKRSETPKSEGRKTPVGRKTPTEDRKTPSVDGRRTPGSGRNSILDFLANASDSDQHEKGKPRQKQRRGLLDSDDEDEEVKTTNFGTSKAPRRSPFSSSDTRKSPAGGRKERAERAEKGGRTSAGREASDEEERPRSAFRPTPNQRGRRTEEDAGEAADESRSRKPRRVPNEEREERESSICRDVDRDPTYHPRPDTEDGEVAKRKQPKHQRKDRKLADDAIDSVEAAQADNKMKYIDPDKEKDEKEEEKKRLDKKPPPAPQNRLKPPPPDSLHSKKKPVPTPRKPHSMLSTTLPASLGAVYLAEDEEPPTPRSVVPTPHSPPTSPRSQPVSPRPLCSCHRAKSSFAILESVAKTMKTPRYKPTPRYAKPRVDELNTSVSSLTDFSSTSQLREAVFSDWYKERMVKAKKEKIEKIKLEKEQEDKEKKANQEKLVEAKLSYDAWVESKKDSLVEQRRAKQKEEKKKLDEVGEQHKKREEADLSYKSWKENKEEVLKEDEKKKHKVKKNTRKDSQEERERKRADSATAFRGWKEKKDDSINDKKKEEQKKLREKQEAEREEQRQREREASEQYAKWMDKKERREYSTKKSQYTSTIEPRKPWSPANRTIPMGR